MLCNTYRGIISRLDDWEDGSCPLGIVDGKLRASTNTTIVDGRHIEWLRSYQVHMIYCLLHMFQPSVNQETLDQLGFNGCDPSGRKPACNIGTCSNAINWIETLILHPMAKETKNWLNLMSIGHLINIKTRVSSNLTNYFPSLISKGSRSNDHLYEHDTICPDHLKFKGEFGLVHYYALEGLEWGEFNI